MVQGTFNYVAQTVTVLGIMTERGEAPAADSQPCALVNVPLVHVTGEVPVLLQTFAIARKLVIMAKWDARMAMDLIARERVTYFVGVPLMSFEIATHPDRDRYDLSTCVTFAAGGAPRPVDHVDRIRRELPHAYPILGYGLTDTPEGADLVVLNTCHIREKATEKTYSELGRIKELKLAKQADGGSMTIAVAGCVAQAEGEEIMRRQPALTLSGTLAKP